MARFGSKVIEGANECLEWVRGRGLKVLDVARDVQKGVRAGAEKRSV